MNEKQEQGKASILTAIFAYTAKQIEINRNKSWQLLVCYFGIFWVGFEQSKFQENELAFLFLIIWVVLTTFFFIHLRHSVMKLKEKRKELSMIYADMRKFSQADDLEILQKKDKKFDERKKFGYIDLDEKFIRKDGIICFNFGKYIGQPADLVRRSDPGYLKWILSGDFMSDTKKVVEEILNKKA